MGVLTATISNGIRRPDVNFKCQKGKGTSSSYPVKTFHHTIAPSIASPRGVSLRSFRTCTVDFDLNMHRRHRDDTSQLEKDVKVTGDVADAPIPAFIRIEASLVDPPQHPHHISLESWKKVYRYMLSGIWMMVFLVFLDRIQIHSRCSRHIGLISVYCRSSIGLKSINNWSMIDL